MSRVSVIAVVLLSLAGSAAALAEEPLAPQQCWTPTALSGTEAELKHVPDHQSLDLAPLKQVTLAPAIPVAPALRGSIRSVELPPDKKLIALTFDLCEENGYVSGYDGRIVDLLRAARHQGDFLRRRQMDGDAPRARATADRRSSV